MAVAIEKDQLVVVTDGQRGHRLGKVVSIGRVWVHVKPDGYHHTIRFRLDTQTDGRSVCPRRFYTTDQWSQLRQKEAAREELVDQGIVVRHDSRWYGREIELAELLRAGQHLKPGDTNA